MTPSGLRIVSHSLALVFATTGLLSMACWSAEERGIALVRKAESPYRIVLEPTASPSERRAAEELQSHFKACTGVQLPIVEDPKDVTSPMIVLGCGSIARKLGVDPKPEELGEQGYRMRTVSPHVVIAGTGAAGTLYGVYDFLEGALGVRWYAPGVSRTPEVKDLALPTLDKVVKPAFAWRNIECSWDGGGPYRARMRNNSGGGGADNPEGIQYAFDRMAHSYFSYVSPGEFFATHPEYFSEIGGVRREVETQLCLTNPDVLEIVAERMLKRIADSPGMRQYNFSQMDWYNYCQCPRCTEINGKYGTRGGTQFWFVNQLAERIAKVHPDKLIGTLAYMYTEEPPKGLKMQPNVAVWLCHMYPSCDSHPIATCPLNAEYRRRAVEWSKICSHVYVWHYMVDFAHLYAPFPNFDAMAADMRFYRDVGVEGIFLQGGRQAGGEFYLLRPYYGAKLLWNPDQDADTVMRDFLQGYYAGVWEPIYRYIRLLQDKVEKENIHMHLYTNPAQGYLPDDLLVQADDLFNQAESAVEDNEEVLERVRVARMPLTYARLFPRNGYVLRNSQLVFQGPFASLPETQAFIDRMKKHGFDVIRESGGDPKQLLMLSVAFSMPSPTVSIQNDHLSVDVVPLLGGRALRIVDKRSGQCITAYDTRRNLFYPFCGGEETRLGSALNENWSGFMEQYSVTGYKQNEVTVQAKTAGGITLRRKLSLAPDIPLMEVTIEAKNDADKPRHVIMRSHLELELGDLPKTRVRFVSRAGENVSKDMQSIIAGMREGEHYLDKNAPQGAWTFTGTKGLEVTQTFDDAAVDFTWLYAYPDYLNELELEVWKKSATLAPGETASFSHSIEIRAMPK
jgi:hypothetical protein